MSTQEKPSLWKGYVIKAVVAALVLYAGYEVFVDKPSLEPVSYTHLTLPTKA